MLNVITTDEAIEILNNNFAELKQTETVCIDEALGRVAAEDIISTEDMPSFSRSTMDGYAVKSADTYGCSESMPSMLNPVGEILMGESTSISLSDGCCARISTGGMLPEGADAVVPVENTEEDNGLCLVFKSVSQLENVVKKGDDIRNGSSIIRKGTRLLPAHIGLLAGVGQSSVKVRKKPRIGIISTGDEIIGLEEKMTEGKIREVNSRQLGALCRSYGCDVMLYGTVRDDYDRIYSALNETLSECDAVLISGGSSAGAKDMTVNIIEQVGSVLAHGLAMKPGKPTIIGKAGEKAVFGLPGHPAACFFVTEIIVKKLVDILLGRKENKLSFTVPVSENISSNHGREEYICVKIINGTAVPIYSKSGIVSTLCEADGYMVIGRNCEGIKSGEAVEVYRFGGIL